MQIKPENLKCWKCGAGLDYLLMPLSRNAHCKACEAALHVCRMCRFYEPRVAKQCREPVADAVKEKDRPNFCDYLELNPEAWEPPDHSEADVAAADLNDLFGLDTGGGASGTSTTADQARQELDDLFDLDK
ncbi:MAG: hypothetical protein OXG54_00760 [Gammaproteobacteria bacterium]|nr:hypothetical protein [Gammaproteobacteria bacterium]